MKSTAFAALLLASGCYIDTPVARDQRRTLNAIRQEHRWAADRLARRMPAEEVSRVRAGDSRSSREANGRLRRLIDALERTTWIREATPRGLWASADEPPDQDELAFRFARAARIRADALAQADELAEALAVSTAPGALALGELRRALAALARIEESEPRIASEIADLARKERGLRGIEARFPASKPPSPRPFLAATSAYLRVHPAEVRELDRFPGPLAADVGRIKSSLEEKPADEPRPAIEPKQAPGPKEAVRERAGEAHREADAEAARLPLGPSEGPTLALDGDAREMLKSRGPPRAIAARPGGLFALRYQEPRPCEKGSCETLVDFLYDATGKFVREEVVEAGEPEDEDD